ncbi:MAG TPA: amidase [Patescibacteria group bacterium]|nr:amidase [Patescibacteria group bacterium]
MAAKRPTFEEVSRIAEGFRMKLSPEQARTFHNFIQARMRTYDRLDELVEPSLEVKYPDRRNWRPAEKENPFGAWYWRAEIKGAPDGPLAGKTLAVKDNVFVAGVPMMIGSRLIEGFVPNSDATIVTRILNAGGTILGKTVCENLCFSGNSHTSQSGVVRNPYDLSRSPGGSSTGSAALVAAGLVDLAIGTDQAGSIRIPGSWSGLCSLKPTYGLVPYTGIGPMEATLDHVGPIARTAADAALLLEVIAGPDGLDPRQRAGIEAREYTAALTGDVKGLRIGIVKEGFATPHHPHPEKDVDDAVRDAAHSLEKLGAKVGEISLPMHLDGFHIWIGIAQEGMLAFMVDGHAVGRNWKGYYPTDLVELFGRNVRQHGEELSVSGKARMIFARFLDQTYNGRYYAKAQNLARALAAAYDDAFRQFDILVMPTTPIKAAKIPSVDAPLEKQLMATGEMIPNTCPLNATGHPALNVPCAMSEGLPVGMMFIGRMGEDATLLRAGDAFGRHIFTPPPPPSLA